MTKKIRIPQTVWALGLVSLFMDISSELVHSLLPVYLVTTLGASVATVGVIEGVAEATAPIVKVFSGALSDFLGRRKLLLLLGYGMASLTKPLFPLARSAEAVFLARFLDRIGKGIRGAPRDALIADVAPPEIRGACFGLRQSMDTVGAVLGPALALLLMFWFSNNIKRVLWFAVLPAVLTVVLILFGVQEPEHAPGAHRFRSPLRREALRQFPPAYWGVVAVGAAFALARFSEAFLVLRVQQVGLAIRWVPLVMIVMSIVYSLTALPAGMLSDRLNRRSVLAIGLSILTVADLVLARATSPWVALVGVGLWGLHLGCTEGILSAMIADVTPRELKGTAFGVFNLVSGCFVLLASLAAGVLWQQLGAASTFYFGVALSLVALGLVQVQRPRS